MGLNSNGLKQFSVNLKKLQNKQFVPLDDLMTDKFIADNTHHKTFEELLNASGYSVETESDFEAIPDDKWDIHISNCTNFSSWLEMQQAAANEYVSKQLLG
ncbi:hypothetical protein [Pseudoalteromonas spongiae]|uniref:Uncharacterized protein n=1 Tax=Pseudoalteromonas spongiae TaxID=298657 RepID=A0ABU8EXT1_9GAMM